MATSFSLQDRTRSSQDFAFWHHPTNQRTRNRNTLRSNNKVVALMGVLSLFLVGLSGSITYADKIKSEQPIVYEPYAGVSFDALLILTNHERRTAGLEPLAMNVKLKRSAAAKCQHMVQKDYWAHVSPEGTLPWAFMKEAGIDYKYAGENLARGYSDAKTVSSAWMNGRSHRANVLNKDYTDIGFAACTSSNYTDNGQTIIIVEHFNGARTTPVAQPLHSNLRKTR